MEEEEANTHITNAILKAAKSSIPRGSVKGYTPFWNQELKNSVSMRQAARKEYEKNPTLENRTSYYKLAETKLLTKKNSKRKHGTPNVRI